MTHFADLALATAFGFALGMICMIAALEPLLALIWTL